MDVAQLFTTLTFAPDVEIIKPPLPDLTRCGHLAVERTVALAAGFAETDRAVPASQGWKDGDSNCK